MRAVIDETALRRLFADPNGGLANDRRRRGQNVRHEQRRRLRGHMRAGVVIRERPSPDGPVIQVGVWRRSPRHAPPEVFEVGARAHVIRARKARALAFMYRGRLVIRLQVHHPGMRPRRVFSRSLDAARR